MVYICSPYAGDTEKNVINARRYSRFCIDCGYIPVTPHLLYPQFLNDGIPLERRIGMECGNQLLTKCKELWAFGNISAGMRKEIELANKKRITVRYFDADMKEVTRT